MPCIQIAKGSFLCVGNEPVVVRYKRKNYLFEWTGGCGWMPVNLDGSERLTRVPNAVWAKLEKEHPNEVERRGEL